MKRLTSAGMLHLRKLHVETKPPKSFFALEYEHGGPCVFVTNGEVALAWPRELIDTECARYARLLAVGKETRNPALSTYWCDYLFHEKGTMKRAIEGEPEESGDHEGEMVYTTSKGSKFYYSPDYIEVVESFVEEPKLMLYWAPKTQKLDEHLRMMAVYEGDQIVGAVANIRD